MDIKFEKEPLSYLDIVAWEKQNQELTQEVRLTEELPDAGRVLGCWGQCILRSKEWRSGGMNASGGVMTWTLYAPEDGSEPRCVENWIPMQLKWSFPQTEREGLMSITCAVRSADARVISARKLMIRVSVGALGIAVCPAEAEIPQIGELPEDVQLLQRTYPVVLPAEAGEKTVQLDEELDLPGMGQGGRKLLRCLVFPKVQEQRIIGDRLVFRGNTKLQLLLSDSAGIHAEVLDVPFSTFTDLDAEHETESEAQIDLALTSLEAELTEEGRLRLKAGMVAQYMLWDRKNLTVIEDACSIRRDIRLQEQILMLPALLEHRTESCTAGGILHRNAGHTVDGVCSAEYPSVERQDGQLRLTVPASAQLLWHDGSVLQGTNAQLEGHVEFKQDEDSRCLVSIRDAASLQISGSGEESEIRCDIELEIRSLAGQGMSMVTGMELGELRPEDPNRPSLILRRSAGESLWELAKESGSTVEAIRQANGIEELPTPGQMLLIPVQ